MVYSNNDSDGTKVLQKENIPLLERRKIPIIIFQVNKIETSYVKLYK